MKALATIRAHWPEYAIEAACIGLFMVSAVTFSVVLFHDASPIARSLEDPFMRRAAMGALMALTAIALIYSPFGKRSGAHMNPSVTLTFWRLEKISSIDALGYVLSQIVGAILGVLLTRAVLGALVVGRPVDHAMTRPGDSGVAVAFIAEVAISFLLMATVLYASNHVRLQTKTGALAATLVFLYITFEAPLSGMSMNPARSLGSALVAGDLTDLWIYFVAPPLGMLLAGEAMLRLLPKGAILCAKLHHKNRERCIFLCRFDATKLLGSVR